MKIAMIGTKGIPANWGGIEKYVEEIGQRLVQRGHEVTVFGSNWYCKEYPHQHYKGMRLVRVPAIHFQATDALSNALFASMYCMFRDYDVVHFHNFSSYIFVPFLNLMGKTTVLTTHGLDSQWANPKYNHFAQSVIKNAGAVGLRRAHCVTTVANFWKTRIKEEYGRDAHVLPSGMDKPVRLSPKIIKDKYGLVANEYVLFMGRIDPIKRIDWLLDAWSGNDLVKLVIAGGAQDVQTRAYLSKLVSSSGHSNRVIFTGQVVGEEKAELLSNCRFFVNPSSSEGLPISVLEAMSYERCCLASDIPAHKEVINDGKTGFLFDQYSRDMLAQALNRISTMTVSELESVGLRGKEQVSSEYDWDRTAHLTEQIYKGLINGNKE